MNKYILGVDGMRCGMCEMHIEDVIRKNLKIHKVKASHIKNQAIVFTEENLIEEDFKKIIDPTGYRITSFVREVAVKKFLGWK